MANVIHGVRMATLNTRPRGYRIQVHFDKQQDRRIRRWAKAEDMTISTHLRRVIMRALEEWERTREQAAA
jgi:hypothetical protein